MTRHQFDGLAGADEQHGLLVEPRENPFRQTDAGMRHRHRVGADGGVGAHLLGHRKSVLEKPVEHLAGGAGISGGVKRVLHLAEYLRLAEHHRIEAGRHPECVLDRLLVGEMIDVAGEVGAAESGAVEKPVENLLFAAGSAAVAAVVIRVAVILTAINFGAVAGG